MHLLKHIIIVALVCKECSCYNVTEVITIKQLNLNIVSVTVQIFSIYLFCHYFKFSGLCLVSLFVFSATD